MKPNDTKGFWGSVRSHTLPVSEEKDSYKGHTFSHTSDLSLLDAYKSVISTLRNEWLRVPTASGRPSKGPRFIAVTLCEHENEYGLTSSKVGAGRRWACNTCFSFAPCAWSDGPVPDKEEQEQEWADWAAKQGPNSQAMKSRKRLRIRA